MTKALNRKTTAFFPLAWTKPVLLSAIRSIPDRIMINSVAIQVAAPFVVPIVLKFQPTIRTIRTHDEQIKIDQV